MATFRDTLIERIFPNLGVDYEITSPIDFKYNCIAYAADDHDNFWWPRIHYWPQGVPENEDLNSFIECFKTLGYSECNLESKFETGFEKVAIYINPSGTPTHAAKQFVDGNGIWKSKLGPYKDIEHELMGLSGWFSLQSYGNVGVIMKRQVVR